ncbi:hypothetical protein M5K25_000842 [Dendrobium thyrsiflorum]|uniref:WEB family protein n=1 Tax=Dendrobium thyrsiflorum TaxID=117978 RepID=A0ABD0VXK0_DENTH
MIAAQVPALMEKEGVAPPETLAFGEGSKPAKMGMMGRAVVDTSAPFESVKEAVDRFGGSAVWKSQLKLFSNSLKHHSVEDFELMNVQEQSAQLEKELMLKERETLEVLKELERTKRTVDTLKIRLQEKLSEVIEFPETHLDDLKLHPVIEPEGEIATFNSSHAVKQTTQSAASILAGLSQAKMNLSRKTGDLDDIRASIDTLNQKLEEEKDLIKKTHESLSSKRAIVSSLEDDLKQMNLKLQLANDAKDKCNGDPASISAEIKNLTSEREHFNQSVKTAKSEISRLISEIEQTKVSIKAAEIRCLAAKKMEEAAKATEASALAQTKALINSNSSTSGLQNHPSVVLPIEEYIILTHKIQEADETSRKKIECALLEVEKANQSKLQLMSKMEEAEVDVKTSKKFLEEAMNCAEAANRGKLAVEEALRRRRSGHGQRGRYIHNSTKFKNSYPGHHKRDSRMLDLNGLNLMNDGDRTGLKHTLSIGEILSRKLVGPEDDDYDTEIHKRSNEEAKVSLGQILSRKPEVLSPQNGCGPARKQHHTKRKKFGFGLFSHLLRNEKLKNKKNNKNRKRKQISVSG